MNWAKWCRWVFSIFVFSAAAVYAVWFWQWRVPENNAPLPQSAYVWQYAWNEAVRTAVLENDVGAVSALVVVAAEVMPGGGNPRTRPVLPDYDTLAKLKTPVGLAIRIGPHGGSFDTDNVMTQAVLGAVGNVMEEAREAGLVPSELQLDFDCPSRCLSDYVSWIVQVKKRVAPIPVTITALPSWMNSSGFKRVVDTSDGYVLQVHSVSPPTKDGKLVPLCDIPKTKRWVTRAARFGKPFRVALPTYTYRVAFDGAGRFLGVGAEAMDSEPAGVATWKLMAADAPALAGLMREWQVSHPEKLNGIIWYRIPVSGERFNWNMAAWKKVRNGVVPLAKLETEFHETAELLRDVVLKNSGDLTVPLPDKIILRWNGATVVSADSVGGYKIEKREKNALYLGRTTTTPTPLLSGETWPLGWLRFDGVPTALACQLAEK